MNDILVSVVVPIYKVEKYINECIQSIVNQSYKMLEIILIDDGSPDKCGEICDQWKNIDVRVKVIHKKNQGLGMARNSGIENATGKYICFFDGDDYIAEQTIEKCVSALELEEAEISIFGYHRVSTSGLIKETYIPKAKKKVYCDKEIKNVFLPNLIWPDNKEISNICMSSCFCLYSLDLIDKAKWRFVSERKIIAEDVYSLLVLYNYVKKVVVIDEAFYYYRENQLSLTHTYNSERYNLVKLFYLECKELTSKYDNSTQIHRRLAGPYFSFTIAAMKQIVRSKQQLYLKLIELSKVIVDETLQITLYNDSKLEKGTAKRILYFLIKKKAVLLSYIVLWLNNR